MGDGIALRLGSGRCHYPLVTFNTKDFPEAAAAPWNVVAQTPDEFLLHQFHLNPEVVLASRAIGSGRPWTVGTSADPRAVVSCFDRIL
jgi:hypothetical protein